MSKPHELSRTQLAEVYRDIVRGYSVAWLGKQPVYVKHLTALDHVDLQEYEREQRDGAIERGVPSREAKEEWLIQHGLWSKQQEEDLVQQRDYVQNMEKTRATILVHHQLAQHDQTVAEESKRLREMASKKDALFGLTAEDYAAQRGQFHHMGASLFADRALSAHLHSQEELDQLDDEESFVLMSLFVASVSRFAPEHIRRCSVAPYFTAPFYLCGDQTTAFLGKPMVALTVYQNNLLNSGLHFKAIFQREEVPADIRDDPEGIDAWIQLSQNMKEVASRSKMEGGSTGIVGATARDFKAAGLREDRAAAMKLDQGSV